ncbi:MAG TPA: hypothetical protein PKN44_15990 [Bacteroidales bacterium]|nr:hypothetical protein [Bacteroidales bacterium]HPS62400.1 hypothetical protein [Bacteroidales bacterium]
MKTVTTFFLLILSILSGNSQDLRELKAYLGERREADAINRTGDALHLEQLVYPTSNLLYLRNGSIEKTGQSLASLDTDAPSLRLLTGISTDFADIELIKVRLSESDAQDVRTLLEKRNGFNKLKFILFVCEFSCDSVSLQKFLPRNAAGITLLYSVSIPN